MQVTSTLGLVFSGLWCWNMAAYLLGLVTRKEFLSVSVVVDGLGALAWSGWLVRDLTLHPSNHFDQAIDLFFILFWVKFLVRDYKRWRDTDDDDDFKKRRRAWVRNKLPKLKVRVITNPT